MHGQVSVNNAKLCTKNNESFTVYELTLQQHGKKWVVWKRYKEFHAFNLMIKASNPHKEFPNLPPKKIFSKRSSVVTNRRILLQTWLSRILVCMDENDRYIHAFLCTPKDAVLEKRVENGIDTKPNTEVPSNHNPKVLIGPEYFEKETQTLATSNLDWLLHWCKKEVAGYPNVQIDTIYNSFGDGMALCALLDSQSPGKWFDFGSLDTAKAEWNIERACEVAKSEWAIPIVLNARDIAGGAGKEILVSFLISLYFAFQNESTGKLFRDYDDQLARATEERIKLKEEYEDKLEQERKEHMKELKEREEYYEIQQQERDEAEFQTRLELADEMEKKGKEVEEQMAVLEAERRKVSELHFKPLPMLEEGIVSITDFDSDSESDDEFDEEMLERLNDLGDLKGVSKLLRISMDKIEHIFLVYSAARGVGLSKITNSSYSHTFTMSSLQFQALASDCKICGEGLSKDQIDTVFIRCNWNEDTLAAGERSLSMGEFLEALVRLGNKRYIYLESVKERVSKLINENIIKNANVEWPEEGREIAGKKSVKLILKKFRKELSQIYEYYSYGDEKGRDLKSRKSQDVQNNTMSIQDFLRFVKECHLIDEKVSLLRAVQIFLLSLHKQHAYKKSKIEQNWGNEEMGGLDLKKQAMNTRLGRSKSASPSHHSPHVSPRPQSPGSPRHRKVPSLNMLSVGSNSSLASPRDVSSPRRHGRTSSMADVTTPPQASIKSALEPRNYNPNKGLDNKQFRECVVRLSIIKAPGRKHGEKVDNFITREVLPGFKGRANLTLKKRRSSGIGTGNGTLKRK